MGPSIRTSIATPVVAVLTWAIAAAVAVPVAVPGVASAEPSAVSGRKAVAVGEQALTRLRVVDHNIEKRSAALRRAVLTARRTDADVITLQEVCWWQAAGVVRRNPQWTISWKPERNQDLCRQSGTRGLGIGAKRKVGNLAIWTGGADGSTSTITYGPQRFVGDEAGLACVTWTVAVRHRACSVHLISPTSPDDVPVRTGQAKDIRRITDAWVKQDDLVVLGGDFNAEPRRHTMKWLYRRGGRGSFREASSKTLGGPECRCPRETLDDRTVKIDYVFFSANRVDARSYRSLRIIETASDHHLLVGWADVDASVR